MSDPHDNPAERRFEIDQDGDTAFAAYRIDGDTITFTHTIVPRHLEGHGVGSKLIGYALEQAQARGLKVVPECSFVRAYLERHPQP